MRRSTSSLFHAHSRGSFGRLLFESESNNGGGYEHRSILFRCLQLLVLAFRIVTPISYAYILTLIYLLITSEADLVPRCVGMLGGVIPFSVLTLWMAIEVIFLPYYCYVFTHLNDNLNEEMQHFASNPASRHELVHSCFNALSSASPSPHLYVRKVMEGWFFDLPIESILRGNVALWTSWAFFDKHSDDLNDDEKKENDR